jgi:hypothetical protein
VLDTALAVHKQDADGGASEGKKYEVLVFSICVQVLPKSDEIPIIPNVDDEFI